MRRRGLVAASAVIASLSLALSACSSGSNEDEDTPTAEEKLLTVGWNQPWYAYNSNTTAGNNVTNANVAYMMSDSFNYYDPDSNLVKDENFGTYEKTSDDPLTVKYTLADDVKWSDGTPVDAADLLLLWAANSGNVNSIDAGDVKRDDAGGIKEQSIKGQAFFDAAAYTPGIGLNNVKETPVISDDGKSVTLIYTKPFADWELDMSGTGAIIPAHVVAQKALGITDAQEAKDALIAAIQDKDTAALDPISKFWNTGFDFTALPDDKSLYLSNGPYLLTGYEENQSVTLTKNPDYEGTKKAIIDEVTIVFNEDPTAQLQQLENGEISMFYPQVTQDVIDAANGIDGVEVLTKTDATYEHVDLVQNNKGPFDPASYGGDAEKAKLVRQAFLHAIPRTQVVDTLIKPIQPDAEVRNSFLITAGAPGYDEVVQSNGSADYAEADPALSKQLLDQAGVKTPIKVRTLYAEGNIRRENEFAIYQPALEEAGFQLVDQKDPDWSAKLGDGSYDAVYFGWQSTSTAVTGDAATFTSSGGNNFVGYDNPEVDQLFEDLAETTDEAEQISILSEIDAILFEDAIGITVFQFPGAAIYKSAEIENVNPATLAPTMFYGFWEWDIPS